MSMNRRSSSALETATGWLVVIIAAGAVIGNLRIASVGPLSITPVMVLSASASALALARGKWHGLPYVAACAIALVVYELTVNGLLRGRAGDGEWWRSLGLLVFCAAPLLWTQCLVRMTVIYATVRTATIVLSIAYALGGAAQVLSPILGGPHLYAYGALTRRAIDPALETMRFGGYIRPTGLALEPAMYGLGMSVLLALSLVFWSDARRGRGRVADGASVLFSLGGVVMSLSLTAWAVALVVIICFLVQALVVRLRTSHMWLVLFLAGGVTACLPLAASALEARWDRVWSGTDTSAQRRVSSSLALMWPIRAEEVPEWVLGSGQGMEGSSLRVERIQLRGNTAREPRSTAIVNGWAYISVASGLVGIASFLGMVMSASRFPSAGRGWWHLSALLIAYFFACGYVLAPEWWFVLQVVTMVNYRRPYAPWPSTMRRSKGAERPLSLASVPAASAPAPGLAVEPYGR
jgi:hypothetical protein